MRYWWASQGKNYKHVAQVGDLWTCQASGGRRRVDRELILEIRAGDLVFHYGDEYLRAISEADSSWRPLVRPPYYPRLPGEGDEGWQVQTTPVITGLVIHFSEVASVVSHGSPGPLDRTGRPMQKFLSVLEAVDAGALLSLIGADLGEAASAVGGSERVWGGEATSAIREALARRSRRLCANTCWPEKLKRNVPSAAGDCPRSSLSRPISTLAISWMRTAAGGSGRLRCSHAVWAATPYSKRATSPSTGQASSNHQGRPWSVICALRSRRSWGDGAAPTPGGRHLRSPAMQHGSQHETLPDRRGRAALV